MSNLEIKKKLENILAKIGHNVTSGWNDDLESTFECVITEDGRDVEYNGWFEDLEQLFKNIK